MQRVLRAAAVAAAVTAVSVGAYAVTDGSGDPAAVKSDDGKWSDKNDTPTFKIEPDGSVDWYTYVDSPATHPNACAVMAPTAWVPAMPRRSWSR